MFDWAMIDLPPAPDPEAATADADAPSDGYDGLLIRRTTTDGELTFYRVHAPRPTPPSVFVHVAGLRWRIEEGFASAKELTGLDEHQVRSWTSWHRWTLIAMLAHAFSRSPRSPSPPPRTTTPTWYHSPATSSATFWPSP